LGIPLGVFCAAREGSLWDKAAGFFTFAGFSAPTFWLALIFMSYFGVQLRILPVSGLTSIFFDDMSRGEKLIDMARHLVLPVLVSSITGIAVISRFIRDSVIRELSQNYVRTARAKGLSESVVLRRHVLRNALLPVITILGLSVPGLLGGSVLFESIFSIPGMGRLFYASVLARDYPVIMGILVLGAFLTLLGNLLADMAYAATDPRIRLK
jgi:peptide/nickel transport system permease protein